MESDIRADHVRGKIVWTLDPDTAETYASEISALATRTRRVDHGFLDDAQELYRAVDELRRSDDQ